MKIYRIIIEDSYGTKAKVTVRAKSLQDAIEKVKGYNPEMSHKVYEQPQEKL